MPRIGGILDIADVVPEERAVATTAPLTGGGDLSADRTLGITVGVGGVAANNDPRLNDARSWILYGGGTATAGQVPAWDAGTSRFTPQTFAGGGGGSGVAPTAVKTANYTMAGGDYVPVDMTAGSVTLTLPSAPADKTRVGYKVIGTAGAAVLTVTRGGTDVFNKAGGSTSITATMVNQGALLQYASATGIWYVQADDLPLSGLDSRYAAAGSGGSSSAATSSTLGVIQLAGDLAGTATAPTVPGAQKTVQKSTVGTPVANGYIGADAAGLAPAALLPAASTTAPGIVQLAGDLGGSSSAPTIVRRGPLGGFTQVTYAATVTINAATGNDFYIVATGNLALAAPTGGVDGQQLFIEVYASGGSRTVSFTGTTTLVSGIGTTLTIATGKVGFIGMRYSARSGTPHWVVHAMAAEA